MLAEIRFFCVLALLAISFDLQAQCPPNISSPSDKLILQYNAGNSPSNLAEVDTDLSGTDHDYNGVTLIEVDPTWQTFGPDYSGAEMNGVLTLHYTGLTSSEECEYNEGSLVGLVPVELSSFLGFLKNDNIILSWTTQSEKDNAGFEIEHSFDGERFSTIGMVNGFGNSEETKEYNFLDPGVRNRALSNTAYYRLVQIDFDGTKTYSKIVAIDLELVFKKFEITKITGWDSGERILQVHFYNPTNIRKVNFLVTDINGRLIERRSIFPITGLNVFEVDLSDQKNHLYFLSLNNGKEIIGEKVALGSDF